MAEALNEAWKILGKTGRLTAANVEVAKPALTFAILEAAEKGERNVGRLAVGAVARMAKFEAKIKFERSLVQPPRLWSA